MPAPKASSSNLLVLGLLLAACGGGLVPVHNVRNAPIVLGRGEAATPQLARDAILRALASRSWQIDREGPDGIVATQVSRGNAATVLIQYDARAYSISYLDSSPGLKFNGSGIHRRYNEWVDKLDKTIRKLLASGPGPAAYPTYPAPGNAPPLTPPPPVQPAPGAEPAPATAPVPPPEGAPAVAPQYEAPPPPPPAPAPRR